MRKENEVSYGCLELRRSSSSWARQNAHAADRVGRRVRKSGVPIVCAEVRRVSPARRRGVVGELEVAKVKRSVELAVRIEFERGLHNKPLTPCSI